MPWNTDKRQQALDILAKYEDKYNLKNGITGIDDDLDGYDGYEDEGLGKGFFKKIGSFAKKVGKAIGKGVKAVGKGVAKAGKAIGKGILKFNPLSIAARAGFLLTMKLNMKKMASKLKWGYATKEQAAKKGISAQQWQRSVDALKKVENLFSGKLQGSKNALKNAILKGKAGNLNGIIEYSEYTDDFREFKGLGIAPAAALAAAVPIVKVALDIVKKAGLFGKGEDTSADNLEKELDSSANAAMQSIEAEDPQMKQPPANYIPTVQPMAMQASAVPYNSNQPVNTNSGGGVMNFIKANPMVALAGAGVAGLLIYQVLKPKQTVVRPALNGLDGTRRRKPVKRTVKRKPAIGRSKVKKVKLF